MIKQRQIPGFFEFTKNSKVLEILKKLNSFGFEAYLAGGAVRDMLIQKPPLDFDIATNAKPKDVKRIFPQHILRGEKFGTITALYESESFEITTYRSEQVYSDSRHPDFIKFADTFIEDSKRRDFTINSIYADVHGNIQDPQNGILDLESKCIRTVGLPEERFEEDALRVLRAFRFSSQLGFSIEEKTKRAAIQNWPNINKVSRERIYTELKKMVCADHFEQIVIEILNHQLLDYFVEPTSSISSDFVFNRLLSYKFSSLKFENFILDMAVSQDKNFDLYLKKWMLFLPLMKKEKDFFNEAHTFITFLTFLSPSNHNMDSQYMSGRPIIGKIIRLGLNAWGIEELKLFLTGDFLKQFQLDFKISEEILEKLKSLCSPLDPKIKAYDLLKLGESPGPRLRDKLNLAFEFQIENPNLSTNELINNVESIF